MEYIVLQNAQVRGVIGVLGAVVCFVILSLVSNAALLQAPGFLNTVGGVGDSWLSWIVPLVIGLVWLIATQYQVAVPHLWLMIRIGVQYKGLEWIVQKAQGWGMFEVERAG